MASRSSQIDEGNDAMPETLFWETVLPKQKKRLAKIDSSSLPLIFSFSSPCHASHTSIIFFFFIYHILFVDLIIITTLSYRS